MEVILRINAIGIVEDNGLYRIVPLSDVSREPSPVSFGRDASQIPATGKSIIQVIPIMYLQSTEVVKLIAPFLSANAVVLDVPKSNQIIVVDTDASVRRILTLIETFDNEKQKKKRATVYVYQVQNGKAKDIANLLNQIYLGAEPGMTGGATMGSMSTGEHCGWYRHAAGGTAGIGARPGGAAPTPGGQADDQCPSPPLRSRSPPRDCYRRTAESLVSEITRIFSDDTINSVIVLATPEDYETIKETIAKIDIPPKQVVIEGLIASIITAGGTEPGTRIFSEFADQFRKFQPRRPHGLNGATLDPADCNRCRHHTIRFGFQLRGHGQQGHREGLHQCPCHGLQG